MLFINTNRIYIKHLVLRNIIFSGVYKWLVADIENVYNDILYITVYKVYVYFAIKSLDYTRITLPIQEAPLL